MDNFWTKLFAPVLLLSLFPISCSRSGRITESVRVISGAVNGAVIQKDGRKLVIYGDPCNEIKRSDMILFTHFRRDVIWAGYRLVKSESYSIAPAGERQYFAAGDSIWIKYNQARYHDYYCQTTKFGFAPLKTDRYVIGGDTVKWQGIDFCVFNTPGYTRGAVSYIAKIDGKKFAFTGDLIYGDGKILDLYSFQDAFQGIRGYHGYAARLGQLLSSLELIALQKPDIVVPSRGPVIIDPDAAIQKLIKNIRSLYNNYMSISAYRWYYPEQMDALADNILGSRAKVDWMPYSSVILKDTPSWYVHISNSNLVFAADSSAFLIDCGAGDAYDVIMKMKHSGRLRKLDGVFITHYHDDHTDLINNVIKEFGCPVYTTEELKDILENPSAYHLPCLTTNPIHDLTIMENGRQMKWKDFKVTFYYFPGQTIYHDAALFEKSNGEAIFFVGDSFTPSGIDDYCLLNRNLLHPGTGYFFCLDMLKNLPGNVLLANQHVEPLFAFSRGQLDKMTEILKERTEILKELLPYDDINFGLDEQWARIYPYGQKAVPGDTIEYAMKIFNHSGAEKTFILEPVETAGFEVEPKIASIVIGPQCEGSQSFNVSVQKQVAPGISLLTFGVRFDGWDLHEWSEGLIEITE